MTTQASPRHRTLLLWIAACVPTVAWFVQLNASFLIGVYACARDRMWIFHTISAAALVLAGVGVWCGFYCWRADRRRRDEAGQDAHRLTAVMLFLAVLLLLGILTAEISNWMLEPCI